MALTSPGVEVTIVDQSQYLPAPANSIPLILLATAQDKATPTSSGIAIGTTAANAGKLFRVTSQRDLVTLYGNPFFYTTTDGTPIQGYELNEYGLLAAYSSLGVSNQVFCIRADIDLTSLVGQAGRPTGAVDDGTYWLDTTFSTWGINVFNAVTGQFTLQNPIVITDDLLLLNGYPVQSLGAVGNYAVNALEATGTPTASNQKRFFFKSPITNMWVALGTEEWLQTVPVVVGTQSNPTLSGSDTFTISLGGGVVANLISVTTVAALAGKINALNWGGCNADVNTAGQLVIYSLQVPADSATPKSVTISGSPALLAALGITAGVHYQPKLVYGTSAQQPLWTASQTYPRPTGSVWIKVGSAGNGLSPVISQYNDAASVWLSKNVTLSVSDWAASASIDATGGQAIPQGTLYGQYAYDTEYSNGPLYFWKREATGPTVVTGTNTAPSFTAGPYTIRVYVSSPGSTVLSSAYTVTIPDNASAVGFVTAWSNAAIPNTTVEVATTGAIQLTHTEGGEIVIDDTDLTTGISNGLLASAGFVAGATNGCKYGPSPTLSFTPTDSTHTGSGDGLLKINVDTTYGMFNIDPDTFVNEGNGYAVGDEVTFYGNVVGGTSDLIVTVAALGNVTVGNVASVTFKSGDASPVYSTQLSNWYEFTYASNEGAPVDPPRNNTNWFYSVVDQVDIMVNYNSAWYGYREKQYDSSGFPTASGSATTDALGPIISASSPLVNNSGAALVYGDLWVDTSDLENYPVVWRWQLVDTEDKWVLIDSTDQVGARGIVFTDARWAANGTTNPANDPIPTIASLLASPYLDLDAPEPSLYPSGMLLFNTRRSGYNVKQYRVNYFNGDNFPDTTLPTVRDAWVSSSGLQSNGTPYMGRKAQRAMVVQALRSALDTNQAARDEDNFFNLLATPNYPELQPNMVVLNSDRGETAYILGDTPMRLADSATDIQAWATNAAGATATGDAGCVTRNTYLGLFYPSGIAPDLSGNLVAVPASHMMLRTFLKNDAVAYPWLAAAGTRRGIIDNATNIGYIDARSGEFQTIKTRIGIRDVLYTNFINPMVFFTGNGLLNYGNKTSFNSQSALDRTNVARLVAYVRRQLQIAARPFVFEPNDALTRAQIAGVVESLMIDLVAKRGIYDYLVVCDESNNTPARIDRNELWVDVALEPVKAAEFIYIPVRILNTGELSGA